MLTRYWMAASSGMIALLAGCSGAPTNPQQETIRASDELAYAATSHAREMIGKPYRYGGDNPSGFDCSGLVRYSYARAGIGMPRATLAQRNVTTLISVRSLRPGDPVDESLGDRRANPVDVPGVDAAGLPARRHRLSLRP